jgi:hypothetical protein
MWYDRAHRCILPALLGSSVTTFENIAPFYAKRKSAKGITNMPSFPPRHGNSVFSDGTEEPPIDTVYLTVLITNLIRRVPCHMCRISARDLDTTQCPQPLNGTGKRYPYATYPDQHYRQRCISHVNRLKRAELQTGLPPPCHSSQRVTARRRRMRLITDKCH